MRSSNMFVLTFIGLLMLFGGSAHASDLLLDFPISEGTAGTSTNVTLGFSFSTTASLIVDRLMMWDNGNDGLSSSPEIGLWNSDGSQMLANTTIPSGTSAAAIVSASGLGSWRYVNITPVNLDPGTYVLGSFMSVTEITRYDMTNKTLYPGTSYVETRLTLNGPPAFFAFPESFPSIANGGFGPNLGIQPVPEPTSMILAALATGTVIMARRSRIESAK